MHPEFFMTGVPAFTFKKIPRILTNLSLLFGSHPAFATTPNQFARTCGGIAGWRNSASHAGPGPQPRAEVSGWRCRWMVLRAAIRGRPRNALGRESDSTYS